MRISSPLHIHWEITNYCNFKCKHCYQQNDEEKLCLDEDELFSIAKKIISSRAFQVSISGGEPFSVKNILEILQLFVDNNIDILVCSNGSIINEQQLDFIRQNMIPIQISIDSHDESKNNIFRGHCNAFNLTMRTLNTLISCKTPVSLAFCASKYNYMDIEQVADLCVNTGVENLVIGEMIPVLNNNVNNQLVLEKDQYIHFVELTEKTMNKYKDRLNIYINSEWGFLYSDKYEHAPCSALDRDFAILYNGNISPCPFVRNTNYYVGNVLAGSIESIWQNSVHTDFYESKNLGCDINSCTHFGVCQGGCKAQLANANLNIERKDPRCPIA